MLSTMILSPFKSGKKKKKKKRNIAELRLPPKRQLHDQLVETILSRKKDSSKLPIKVWMKNNRNLKVNWVRSILDQDFNSSLELSSLSLIYCFFLGDKDGYIESGVGKPGNQEELATIIVEHICMKFRQQLEKYYQLVESNT
jgi:hypothetical protein